MAVVLLSACSYGLHADDPAALQQTSSIGALIAEPGGSALHIVYVHGMHTTGPGFSQQFIKGMCRYVHSLDCSAERALSGIRYQINVRDWPKEAKVMGRKIWRSQLDWNASQPFIVRHFFPSRDSAHRAVYLDEVNWWPLLFPFKCQFLVGPESQLSGIDQDILNICTSNTSPYHKWLSDDEVANAKKGPYISGGGSILNALFKQEILNFGMSDAVIALGPMKTFLHTAINKSMQFSLDHTNGKPFPENDDYVLISESLGSFVVMDTLNSSDKTQCQTSLPSAKLLEKTKSLYFFANQFALLELGRVQGLDRRMQGRGPPNNRSPAAQDSCSASPWAALTRWAEYSGRRSTPTQQPVRQIIAFNDPSDILTFDVPKIPGAKVVNVYDHNETYWLGLLAWPLSAHLGHSTNDAVLKQLFLLNP